MSIEPNTVLPKGARHITPVKKEIGGYVKLPYDAKVTLNGVTWYRVQGGFSGHGDREDWVADIPLVNLSVHDYEWREPRWGFVSVNSFEEATEVALKGAPVTVRHRQKELRAKLALLRIAQRRLKIVNRAIKSARKEAKS